MKKCVVLGSMPVTAAMKPYVQDAQMVIAVDAGWENATVLGVKPTLLAGDFDSMPRPQTDVNTVVLPTEKDVTDTYFAAQKAVEAHCEEVVLLGALGGRLDHTMANLHTLVYLARHGIRAMMADEQTRIYVLLQGKMCIPQKTNTYLSVFPVGDVAQGVTLRGVYYTLENATLCNDYPVGVSNEFTHDMAEVSVQGGGLYIMVVDK